jgi:GNAT superfamily N-acetyltransferase
LQRTAEELGYRIEPLGRHHDRSQFSCGTETLDRYLREQARQDAQKRVAAPFVLLEGSSDAVIGYYTLSAISIDIGDWPEELARKLPKYPAIPATLLGRLALDKNYRGKGLGKHLLMDALYRSWRVSNEIASVAVIVDAKDKVAQAFYSHYEFRPFPDQPNSLFLAMQTVEKLFSRKAR